MGNGELARFESGVKKTADLGGPWYNAFSITRSGLIDSELVHQGHQVLGLVREIGGGL